MSQSTEPHTSDPDPLRHGAENGYPLIAAVSLTALTVTSLIDGLTRMDVPRGLYAGLAGLSVVGFAGWLVRSAQHLLRAEVQQLRAEVAELRRELRDARPPDAHWAPPWGRGQLRAVGGTYASQTSMDVTTQPLPRRVGLDAETIADAREIARKMLGRDEG